MLTVPVSLLQSTRSLSTSSPWDGSALCVLLCHCGIRRTGKEQMEFQRCSTPQICPPLLPLKQSLRTRMWLPHGNCGHPALCGVRAEKEDGRRDGAGDAQGPWLAAALQSDVGLLPRTRADGASSSLPPSSLSFWLTTFYCCSLVPK